MKIGIISMQRVYNHGSFLQSYGLKSLIEDLGHDVRFVDLRFGDKVYDRETKSRPSTPFYYHPFKKANHILFNLTKNRRFRNSFFPISGINNPILEKECDMVVIGSDEVFNFYQNSPWGLTDQLFGKTDVPAISYAGSFGNSTFSIIEKLKLQDRLMDDMSNFKAISVRDRNSFECVKRLLNIEPEIHLDPVLIYDFAKEQERTTKLKFHNFIAVYSYDNGINDKESINCIKSFAKKGNRKIVSLGFFNSWCDYNIICSPFELLHYFKAADYVITDTFHGTVISIKQNKQFVTIVRNYNSNKLGDLLRRFNLENRQIIGFESFNKVIDEKIDYERINTFIMSEKERTLDYLRRNLNDKNI